MEHGKVVGTLEDLHYIDEIWSAMSLEQRKQVLVLRQAKSSPGHAVKATKISGARAQLTAVSDSIV